jgi:hypothetical protein
MQRMFAFLGGGKVKGIGIRVIGRGDCRKWLGRVSPGEARELHARLRGCHQGWTPASAQDSISLVFRHLGIFANNQFSGYRRLHREIRF